MLATYNGKDRMMERLIGCLASAACKYTTPYWMSSLIAGYMRASKTLIVEMTDHCGIDRCQSSQEKKYDGLHSVIRHNTNVSL